MKVTNKHNLPEILLRAARSDKYSRGAADISVTQLIDSPRVLNLREKHKDDMEFDVSDRIWALLGSSLHGIIAEHADDLQITEERLFVKIEGWTLSGAIDLQDENDGTFSVIDWKTTSSWTLVYNNTEHWERQLNVYATMVEIVKDVTVADCRVIALIRDWQRKKAETDRNYPKAPIIEVPLVLWPREDRVKYIKNRMAVHQQAAFDARLDEDNLVKCTDEERWAKESQWAVMKKGNKRAVRVFNTEDEAKEYVESKDETLTIEHRQGEYTRCVGDYCGVSQWCSQHATGKLA